MKDFEKAISPYVVKIEPTNETVAVTYKPVFRNRTNIIDIRDHSNVKFRPHHPYKRRERSIIGPNNIRYDSIKRASEEIGLTYAALRRLVIFKLKGWRYEEEKL